MEEMYKGWIQQLREALGEWGRYSVRGDYDKVVVLGMGGSGIVGDILSSLSITNGGPLVYTLKSHYVPGFIDSRTLVLAVSYSGNTLETRIAMEKALERTRSVVVVSSGGYLREYALKHGLLYVPLTTGLAPRASLPSMLFKILGLLDSTGLTIVSRRDAEASLVFLGDRMGRAEEEAYRLAEWVHGSQGLLVIASHTPLEALALRGKNEFNENSKIPVKVEVAPEWMHNDIVGYEHPVETGLKVIEVVDPGDDVGARLVDFMHNIYVDAGARTYRLTLEGERPLDKILYGSLVFGLASCRLARLRGLDPLETRSINRYKESVYSIFSGQPKG